MIIPKFPNPAEIALAIEKTEAILADKKLNQRKNFALKEGYTECVRMMKDRLLNPENPFFVADAEEELETAGNVYREQMLPIKKLKTEIGRTIAVLCNDFLNGQDYEQMFLDEAFMKGNKDKILGGVISKYEGTNDYFSIPIYYGLGKTTNILGYDGYKYTAVMDNQFKMAGTIRVVDGQVFLEQNELHGVGQDDEVEKKYFWAVNDGSQAILDFMGISNFKIIE
ncbi:MAG: hypothetical protein ABFC57_10765 [Veillonellales bacterium]